MPKRSKASPKLHDSLVEFHRELRKTFKRKWDRVLPLDEMIFDRWEKAEFLKFSPGANIHHQSYVYGKVSVGKDTWVGPYTILDGTGGLTIGANCSISAGVQIYTHDSVAWAITGGKAKYERAGVKIGNCCYIGPQVVIAKGVTIGDHCVIGACSFVDRNLPPYTVAFGVPCRKKGKVLLDRKKGTFRIVWTGKTPS